MVSFNWTVRTYGTKCIRDNLQPQDTTHDYKHDQWHKTGKFILFQMKSHVEHLSECYRDEIHVSFNSNQ